MTDRLIETIRIPSPIRYDEGLRLQRERHALVAEGRAPNALFLLEHAPVITLGRNAHESNLLLSRDELQSRGIEVFETDRGGDVTYHGPGQLVAYPILNLRQWRPSVHWYVHSLEEVLIQMLKEYGLDATRIPGLTGVWVDGAKIAAIGVGIRKWVTFHGIALNVNPDLSHFGHIVPCGIANRPLTSLEQLLGAPPTMAEAMETFGRFFRTFFDTQASDFVADSVLP